MDTFFESVLIQDAVIRRIEIIGEATKNLSAELRGNILIYHGVQ
ncbi:HepT-like ribonuclease domain-containing protein [Desulfoscipio sp. XC116]